MSGLSVKLPLTIDSDDGAYKLNKTYEELAQQNLKHLILIAPGERIMDMNFGVGLRNYLFENMDGNTLNNISGKIYEQIGIYMPYLQVDDLLVEETEANSIHIRITYTILPLDLQSVLEIAEEITKI